MLDGGADPGAMARALIGGSLRLRRGENLLVETWSHCLPYASACVVEARKLGAHPLLVLEDEGAYWASVENAPQVSRWSPPGDHEWAALDRTDAFVFFPGPADRPRFRALPAKMRSQLVAYNSDWYHRARSAALRGVRSMLGYATEAQARFWGTPLDDWRRALYRATVEVKPEPLRRAARSVAAKLRLGREARITAPNGTDVRLRLRHRRPSVDDGVVTADDVARGQNMTVSPPGTVVVAVDERSAEGLAVANRPSFLVTGRVEGGEWEMSRGRLAAARYTSGQAEFEGAYEAAAKGRDVLSILSVGLNPALGPGVPQVEDQEAGAVALGIGGNDSYGGAIRNPYVSWIVIGEATLAVDGKPVCDRGQIL